VKLPGWLYPVVFDASTGQVQYDNYESVWGDCKHTAASSGAPAGERRGIQLVRIVARRIEPLLDAAPTNV
jgi:hypothetical protein